jgi:hypothetical protein
MDVSWNGAQRSGNERNRPQRRPRDDKRNLMTARRRGIIIARQQRDLATVRRQTKFDDRATTIGIRRPRDVAALSSRGRRCGRLRSRKNSAALRFHAHIHRPYSVCRPHSIDFARLLSYFSTMPTIPPKHTYVLAKTYVSFLKNVRMFFQKRTYVFSNSYVCFPEVVSGN